MNKFTEKYLTRRNIALAAGMVILVAGALYFGGGQYPVAMVNGQTISAKEFREGYAFAVSSGERIWRISYATSTPEVDPRSAEARAVVLDFIIESNLIHFAFEKEVGSDSKPLLERKIDQYSRDPMVVSAARQVLGLDPARFKKWIIIPQAERDLLDARLYLSGRKIEDWISTARSEAKVQIFSSELRWDGTQVVVNGM